LSFENPVPMSLGARGALENADLIVIGPGDLYTSSIAALLPEGMKETIAGSKARLVYISNLFTKTGQTEDYTVREHVEEIARYAGREPDIIFINQGDLTKDVLQKYAEEGEYPPKDDYLSSDARVRRLPLVSVYAVPAIPGDPLPRSLVRHDPAKLAAAIATLFV
ncbi:MAG: 2-phospho-L-lactate transferase CofD family protein, partial [bacterium]|nr:2-phospho-L-lactate transferase CofD family protein [bacterium]